MPPPSSDRSAAPSRIADAREEEPLMAADARPNPAVRPSLPLAVYRLEFAALQPIHLPAYAGSAWRGAFGHALKKLVCATREPACPTCLLYRSCIYPYLFETPPDPEAGKLRKYPAAPHPYLLRPGPGGVHPTGAIIHVDAVLFGHGNRHLPYLLHAFDRAGQRGVGQGDGRLELSRVMQRAPEGDWRPIYRPGEALRPLPTTIPEPPPVPARLMLHLLTPLRLTEDNRLISQDRFRFHHLFSSLLRRISLLIAFHADEPLEADFAGLTRAARAVALAGARLRWHDWTRYSSR